MKNNKLNIKNKLTKILSMEDTNNYFGFKDRIYYILTKKDIDTLSDEIYNKMKLLEYGFNPLFIVDENHKYPAKFIDYKDQELGIINFTTSTGILLRDWIYDIDIQEYYDKSIFDDELKKVNDNDYRNFLIKCLENCPKYFWVVPASSTGKYHPSQDLGNGGLIRHSKTSIQCGLDLLRSEIFIEENKENNDIIIGALMLHDCIKNGFEDSGYTEFLHPIYASNFILSLAENENDKIKKYANTLSNCILSHMGKWNTHEDSNIILNMPISPLEKLVANADYMSSRKYINLY